MRLGDIAQFSYSEVAGQLGERLAPFASAAGEPPPMTEGLIVTRVTRSIGKSKSARRRRLTLEAAVASYRVDRLESRMLLSAVVAPPDVVTYANGITGPLPPRPGHSYYVSGYNSQGQSGYQWENASAITPNLTNDLVLNSMPSATTYQPQYEGGGVALLTNGLTQTQVVAAPSAAQLATGDGGASDYSNSGNVLADATAQQYFVAYQLGAAGGATPSSNGYDISEIDVITGHQDYRTGIYRVDVLVEPAGSSQFLSLSGGRGFSLTSVPNGQGGTVTIDKGSAQMAIVNSAAGQPLAQNIKAAEIVVMDCRTYLREMVVTGTSSGTAQSGPPAAPTNVSAAFSVSSASVTWNASANASGYTILRSSGGPYAAVGSVFGQTSFIDSHVQPSSSYTYEVIASGNGDSAPSNPAPGMATPAFGATGYIFQNQFWQGSPTVTENLPQIDYSGGGYSPAFPLTASMNPNAFSAFIDGKIKTDLSGFYTFLANTDDDGYLYVNGQLVSANPGSHAQRDPLTTLPISLAANSSYDFVFLENNSGGSWGMNLFWREPTTDGTPGPVTLIAAGNLTPSPDLPPTPPAPSATALVNGSVQLNWNPAGDVSSYAYVVERAPSDAAGNPVGSFTTVGQVFSGPGTAGAATTWGASSFVDPSTMPNMTYVYEVGSIMPGQSAPSFLSARSIPVTTPSAVTAAAVNGILAVTLGPVANDTIHISTNTSGQIVVSEGQGPVFMVDRSVINSLDVRESSLTGPPPGQDLVLDSALALTGTASITGMYDVHVNGPLSANQIGLGATDYLQISASLTTAGAMALSGAAIAIGAPVDSGGGPISVDATSLFMSGDGTIDARAGNVLYTLPAIPPPSASLSIANILGATVCSGTVTLQTFAKSESISGTTSQGLTGILVLNAPNATLTTAGLDTSAGNGALKIVASSVVTYGPVSTGTGRLTLGANHVAIGAAVTAGGLVIAPGSQVSVDGSTITVAGDIVNAGNLAVASGSAIIASGSISGSGGIAVGNPAGAGTVAYYHFEGTAGAVASGNGTIIDSSGNGLNATPVNGPAYSNNVPVNPVPLNGLPDGTSLNFDGTSQRVFIPDSPAFQLTKSMTLEAYIYAEPTLTGSDEKIIFRGDNTLGFDPYSFGTSSGGNILVFDVTNQSNQVAQLTATIPLNQWIHVAGTLDDVTGLMGLYVNGKLLASQTTPIRSYGLMTGGAPGLGIAGAQSGFWYPQPLFHGMIDEVRISNVALLPSQFLDAPQKPESAVISAGSFSQASVAICPTGTLSILSGSPPTVSTTNALNIVPGGRLDLANNALVINYAGQADPLASIRAYLASAYDNGLWDGSGITSSSAAANPTAYGIGYADSADGTGVNTTSNTIELKYTLLGDTNLDGTVNLWDLLALTRNFGKAGGWDAGDCNYDGTTNLADWLTLTRNFGKSAAVHTIPPSALGSSTDPVTRTAARTGRRVAK